MIEVEKISKKFKISKEQKKELEGDRKQKFVDAVSEVSFKCQPGRIFSLLGPNGAGKTTILRMIATMLRPSSGTIRVGDYDTVKEPEMVRKTIGFLTGTTGLYARLNANEIIKYYGDLHGMDKAIFEKRKQELFSLLNINDFAELENYPRE